MRLIAFYLPQFHPIPENDAWWGKGFTEWTNVAKARPLFPGHEMPNLPGELGFYDLRVPEVRKAQADLARIHGIAGFCYYHYWFNGRLLLERPFEEVLRSGEPDFPFCLCWANENWTRAWDGHDRDVLLHQEHSDEDDREHLRWFARSFRDPRYIRVNGRPLLLVYRTSLLPDPGRTARIWHEEARTLGIEPPYLCSVESLRYDRPHPGDIGFDAAVEFQPDWLNLCPPSLELGDGNRVCDYDPFVEMQLHKPAPPYRRFPCVTPGWDNAARRQKDAFTIRGSTPEAYQRWLEAVLESSTPGDPGEDLVFVNAWNEWGEGAHLEPTQRWGRKYLEATRRALRAVERRALNRCEPAGIATASGSPVPRVSVCIPTYNGAAYVGAALQSVLGQTLADFELLVVDDRSTDGTLDVVRSFSDPRISVRVNERRLGIAGNWNRCLELASAPFVCLFHQDDLMMPSNLADKVRLLEANPVAGMVFSNVWQIGPDDELISKCWYAPPEPEDHGVHDGLAFFRRLLLGPNIVCCPGVVARREVYDTVGMFDESLPFTLDWEMWLRIASRYSVGYLSQALVKYRRHPGMETSRFLGISELEHSLSALLLSLDRARGYLSDAADLRLRLAEKYRDVSLEKATEFVRLGWADLAAAHVAFAAAIPKRAQVDLGSEDFGSWMVDAASRLPNGGGREDGTLGGSIDAPAHGSVVSGDLRVRGWALAPGDAMAVSVSINGTVCTPSSQARSPRPDLAAARPDLGDPSSAGFEQVFPWAPGRAGRNELSVKILTRDGRYRTLGPVPFDWEPAA